MSHIQKFLLRTVICLLNLRKIRTTDLQKSCPAIFLFFPLSG